MSKFVHPKVYWIGSTVIDWHGLQSYLQDTGQEGFMDELAAAGKEGLNSGEMLCSFYAKLCYASLVPGKNKNIKKTRAIYDNLIATIESGHGSVFEHCNLNFVTTNCSRIYTHEQVRHRAGTAFSQTSGRYVRTDEISFVHDPILDDCKDIIEETLTYLESQYKRMEERKAAAMTDFSAKKKITSAMRRILPNGQANEMGFSVNLRALRHTIQMRTAVPAEWEIRDIFGQVYRLVKGKFPAIFADAQEEEIEGATQVTFKNPKI